MAYDLTPLVHECPICSSKRCELLHQLDSTFTAQYYVLQELEPERHLKIKKEIERLWEGQDCRIVRCRDCQFVSVDPFIPGDQPFYSLFYDNPKFPKWKWEYEHVYQHLKEAVEKGQLVKPRILEIGAGTGMFVKRVSEDITSPDNIVTLEYSDAGKQAIEAMGIKCIQQDVLQLGDEYNASFDVICMYQVLEHINNLDQIFAKLNQLSTPMGLLFIAVPGNNMMTYYEEHDAWIDNAPVHLSRWNRGCFEMIGSRHGWRLDSHEYEPTSLLWKLLQFSLYKYVYNTKNSGTIYNWAESRRNRLVRYFFQVPLISLTTLRSIPKLLKLAPKDMGHAQTARFIHESSPRT